MMHTYILLLLCAIACVSAGKLPGDLTTCDLVKLNGLPCEVRHVFTDDNYVLQVERIPNPGRPSVLLLHGLHMNSGVYVTNMRHNTLSFMLFDAGYDVWLLNFRGTNASRSNTKIPPTDAAFWQFSWVEYAVHDVPATVDYISSVTGKHNVSIIGHSEGGAALLSALALLPSLRSRVTLSIAMAPAVYLSHFTSGPCKMARDTHLFELLYKIGVKELGPGAIGTLFDEEACKHLQTLCEMTIAAVAGWDFSSHNLNKSRLDIYSTRLFDFGADINLIKYGQPTAPDIPLNQIDSPLALYYGSADAMVDPFDVETYLIPSLSKAKMLAIKKLDWNHADFVFGTDVAPFSEIVNLILKHVTV